MHKLRQTVSRPAGLFCDDRFGKSPAGAILAIFYHDLVPRTRRQGEQQHAVRVYCCLFLSGFPGGGGEVSGGRGGWRWLHAFISSSQRQIGMKRSLVVINEEITGPAPAGCFLLFYLSFRAAHLATGAGYKRQHSISAQIPLLLSGSTFAGRLEDGAPRLPVMEA